MVWRLDRLGRNLKHLIEIVDDLENRGIGFVSITEGFNTTTNGDKLVFQIFRALAEFEIKLLAQSDLFQKQLELPPDLRPEQQHIQKKIPFALYFALILYRQRYNISHNLKKGNHLNSKEIIKIIEADGWQLVRAKGSHHHFKHPTKKGLVTIPHPKRTLPKGMVSSILKQAGLK